MNIDTKWNCGVVPVWRERYAMAVLALAVLLVCGFFSMTWQTGDDARYIGLAQSLLDGHGFIKVYLPEKVQETITPPAQPLLIALAMKIGGRTPLPGKVLSAGLFVFGSLLIYAWAFRNLQDRFLAFCCTVMGQFTFGILTMSCWYMVEMNYIAASFLVLWMATRKDWEDKAGWVLLVGLASGYVYLVRATGLSFAAAGGFYFLFRRDWKNLTLFCAGFMLLAGPWMVRTYLVTGATEAYLSFQKNMVGADQVAAYPWMRIPGDIATAFPVYYVQAMPDALFYRLMGEFGILRLVGIGFIEPVVRWCLLALITLGFIKRMRRPGFLELYWIFYWLIITAPPFPPQGHWYIYPVLPIAALYLIDAVRWLTGRIVWIPVNKIARGLIAGLMLYTLATALTGAAIHAGKEHARRHMASWAPERYYTYKNEYLDAWARFVEAGMWVSSNYPPDTLIISRQPNHMYLITGHEGWRYDLPEVRGRDLFERIEIHGTNRNVVLVEDAFIAYKGASFSYGGGHWALADLFEKHAENFEQVYECGPPLTRVWLYKAQPVPR